MYSTSEVDAIGPVPHHWYESVTWTQQVPFYVTGSYTKPVEYMTRALFRYHTFGLGNSNNFVFLFLTTLVFVPVIARFTPAAVLSVPFVSPVYEAGVMKTLTSGFAHTYLVE